MQIGVLLHIFLVSSTFLLTLQQTGRNALDSAVNTFESFRWALLSRMSMLKNWITSRLIKQGKNLKEKADKTVSEIREDVEDKGEKIKEFLEQFRKHIQEMEKQRAQGGKINSEEGEESELPSEEEKSNKEEL